MEPTPNPDRLRALTRGELSREERAALERELASEPGVRGFPVDFALVSALTAEEGATAKSRTRFEDLESRLAERAPWRRAPWQKAAAAAAALLVAGGLYFAGRACARTDEPLLLTAIELGEPAPTPQLPADLPASWASFEPRGEKGVRFLADLDDAQQLASFAERPLLVYGYFPGCPMCAALDAEVFTDPDVTDLAELTVPVRVNLAALPERELKDFLARGYPVLELWGQSDREIQSLARDPDAASFRDSLAGSLGDAKTARDRRPWSALRELAARYDEARRAESAGAYGAAQRGYGALADAPAPLAERAQAGLARLAAGARATLLDARAAGAGSRRALEQGIERFTGTRWEPDLRAALERLERTGRFPELAEADTSS